jgi:hypothetical protein
MLSAQDIAQRLRLKRHPRSWRGRCPACDYANTFSVRADRAGRPRLFCAACQDRQALAEAVARSTGEPLSTEPANGPDQAANRHRKSEIALQTWRGSGCALGTPAERYLASRGLKDLAASPVLRFRADVCHPEGGRYAALVALVSDPRIDRLRSIGPICAATAPARRTFNRPRPASGQFGAVPFACTRLTTIDH